MLLGEEDVEWLVGFGGWLRLGSGDGEPCLVGLGCGFVISGLFLGIRRLPLIGS